MFVEIKVCYSALFTNLVGWHASAVSFPLSGIILAQLACPLSDMFCFHSGITDHLSTNIAMEWHGLENLNNCLNTNIYSYLETSGGQSANLYFNIVHFFNTSVN